MSRPVSASQAKKAASAAAKAQRNAMKAELAAELAKMRAPPGVVTKYIYSQIPDELLAIIGKNINSNNLKKFITTKTGFTKGGAGHNYNIQNISNANGNTVLGKTLWSYHVFPLGTRDANVRAELARKQALVLKAIKEFLTKNANEIRNSRSSVGSLTAYGRRTKSPSHIALRAFSGIKNLSRTMVATRTGRTHAENTATLAETNKRVANIKKLYANYLRGLARVELKTVR